MHQSILRHSPPQLHTLFINTITLVRGHRRGPDLVKRHAPDQPHDHNMPVVSNGHRSRKSDVVQRLQKRILQQRRPFGQKQPALRPPRPPLVVPEARPRPHVTHVGAPPRRPIREVVPLLRHGPKARAPQPMELEHDLPPLPVHRQVNVALLSHADPISERCDDARRFQVVQRQEVVSGVGQAVSVVARLSPGSLVVHQLVA
mmetsp:Transcript_8155/g.17721  ORF Transcript_8155/g.17721 Transcript_8155/m.17721 type:complete len:202 (-) Transcript_8155:369-974(-)